MNNDVRSLEFQEEVFELVLNVDDNRVSAQELRRLLFHSERLVKSINTTLREIYPEFEFGFDKVDLNVLALEKCCFKLSFSISKKNRKKIKEITHNPTFVAIVGAIIAGLFATKPSTQVNQVYNTYQETVNVTIDNRVILENPTTHDSVDSISTLVLKSDSIHDFSIYYQSHDGMVPVHISKEQLHKIKEELDHGKYKQIELLEVISYNEDNHLWRFRYHGRRIEAFMHDKQFLRKIQSGEIKVKEGDVLFVELSTYFNKEWKGYIINRVRDGNYASL